VDCGTTVVPTELDGVPDITAQLVVVEVALGTITVLVIVLVLAPITVVTVDVTVPALCIKVCDRALGDGKGFGS